MKIYNKEKTEIIENPDLSVGYLDSDFILVHHEAEYVHHDAVEGVEEQGHFKILAKYENGGVSRMWVVDVPGVEAREAWDEIVHEAYDSEEEIQVYIPYTEEQLKEKKLQPYKVEIEELKKYLSDTDYCVIKSIELGTTIQTAYPDVHQKRIEARERINELEDVLEDEEKGE